MVGRLCGDHRHVPRDLQHRVPTTGAMPSFQVHLGGGAGECQQHLWPLPTHPRGKKSYKHLRIIFKQAEFVSQSSLTVYSPIR